MKLRGPFCCLHRVRYDISWGIHGAVEEYFQQTRQYTLNRIQLKAHLAAKQFIQKKLGDMSTEILIGRQSYLRVGHLTDLGKASSNMVSKIKRNYDGKALDTPRVAPDIVGRAAMESVTSTISIVTIT